MNTALILAGGIGSRMGDIGRPKQYLMIHGRPVIDYSLCAFQQHNAIDAIVIVAAELWRDFIGCQLEKSGITKFAGYADPGENRQFSILNGLKRIKELVPNTERVIIHDAVRPVLSAQIITKCLDGLNTADGVMPVLPIKDTCYQSEDGVHITGFLPRRQLFAGQAPEAFHFSAYLKAHDKLSKEILSQISGSSELAYKSGMKVSLIEGSEKNIKITTPEDLLLAEKYLQREG